MWGTYCGGCCGGCCAWEERGNRALRPNWRPWRQPRFEARGMFGAGRRMRKKGCMHAPPIRGIPHDRLVCAHSLGPPIMSQHAAWAGGGGGAGQPMAMGGQWGGLKGVIGNKLLCAPPAMQTKLPQQPLVASCGQSSYHAIGMGGRAAVLAPSQPYSPVVHSWLSARLVSKQMPAVLLYVVGHGLLGVKMLPGCAQALPSRHKPCPNLVAI